MPFAESLFFLALLVSIALVVRWLWRHAVHRGIRAQQKDNAVHAIDAKLRTCAAHGEIPADQLIRIEDRTYCPKCCAQKFPPSLNQA